LAQIEAGVATAGGSDFMIENDGKSEVSYSMIEKQG
jgi:hypothetical protein